MNETASITQIIATANAQASVPELMPAKTLASSASNSKDLLLPNESVATLPSVASSPAKDVTKAEVKTNVAMLDITPQELIEIEKAKKQAKQKSQKKPDEALKNSTGLIGPIDATLQPNAQTQQSIVIQKKEVTVAMQDTKKEFIKQKSGFETFKDSVKQGSENQCSQAKIAMNQCY